MQPTNQTEALKWCSASLENLFFQVKFCTKVYLKNAFWSRKIKYCGNQKANKSSQKSRW
jgi:hypothetical protein